ncbi:MAG: restriction endonuclease subunit S, partial [Coriobacteriaceae bacterium]|nr:restriction endonuclease subunit S [Coriobacteriaceae bacterium]
LISQASVGSAQKHFNVGAYKKMKIAVPPLADQAVFVDFLQQVDKSRFAYIWNRTKSVGQTLSGPSSTLAIQHVEPQTRSKYWADASSPPFWLSVGAMLVQKTPRVCVLIPTGQIGAIWCNSSTWVDAWNGWQSTHLLRIKTQTCPIFWRGRGTGLV